VGLAGKHLGYVRHAPFEDVSVKCAQVARRQLVFSQEGLHPPDVEERLRVKPPFRATLPRAVQHQPAAFGVRRRLGRVSLRFAHCVRHREGRRPE
jgi:hypothetical protein